MLLAGVFLGLAAPLSHAASGPALQFVAPHSMADAPGGTKVTFAWRKGDPGSGPIPTSYTLKAVGAEGLISGSPQYGTGAADDFFESTLNLVDGHFYVLWVEMTYWEWVGSVPISFTVNGPSVSTTADFIGDFYPSITINGGAAYTNRRSVSVRIDAQDATTTQAQVLLDSPVVSPTANDFTCTSNGNEPTCPFDLSGSNAAGFKYATVQRDLSAGDGWKLIWAQGRDDAQHPNTTGPYPGFGRIIQGNPSFFVNDRGITLDTVPPVPKLASATVSGVAGSPVTLDATPSTDASAGVKTNGFVWKWGDGSADTTGAGKLSHQYPGPGTYNGTVVVHDNAGNAANANDTNFASTTFKVTITAKPVATPTPTPTPTPGTGPTPTPTPGALDLSGAGSGDTGGTGNAKTDIPQTTTPPGKTQTQLIDPTVADLGGKAQAIAGPVSSAKIGSSKSGQVKAGKPFDVQVQVRAPANLKARVVDERGKTVGKATSTERAGKQEFAIRAPKAPGDYDVIVDATLAKRTGKGAPKKGTPATEKQQKLTVPIKVTPASSKTGPSESKGA